MVFCIVFILCIAGCKQQDAPEIQTIDPMVINMSSDPQIQKELMFMRGRMGYDLSKVYIGKAEASGYYGVFEGWDGVSITREFIQQQMLIQQKANQSKKKKSLFYFF